MITKLINTEVLNDEEVKLAIRYNNFELYKEMNEEIGVEVRKTKNINGGRPYMIYEGEESYLQYINKCKHVKRRSGTDSSLTGSRDFTGTDNIEEAFHLAENGWDYGIKELKIEGGVMVAGTTEFNSSMVGSVVNIPNYINGLPDDMFQIVDEREYDLPLVTVYVRLAYLARVTTSQALKHCGVLVNWFNQLQKDHNLRIIGIMDNMWENSKFGYIKTYTFQQILIKDFDQRFVINNIAFSFHPSFFRRLGFSRYEEIYGLDWGYGTDPGIDTIKNLIGSKLHRGRTYLIENCTVTRGELDLKNDRHCHLLKEK